MPTPTLDEAQIREAAYLLWLDEGQPMGRDQEHWLKAIDALSPAKPKAKPARKAATKPRAAKAKTSTKSPAEAKAKNPRKPRAKAAKTSE